MQKVGVAAVFFIVKVVSKFDFGHFSEKKWLEAEFGFVLKIDSYNLPVVNVTFFKETYLRVLTAWCNSTSHFKWDHTLVAKCRLELNYSRFTLFLNCFISLKKWEKKSIGLPRACWVAPLAEPHLTNWLQVRIFAKQFLIVNCHSIDDQDSLSC